MNFIISIIRTLFRHRWLILGIKTLTPPVELQTGLLKIRYDVLQKWFDPGQRHGNQSPGSPTAVGLFASEKGEAMSKIQSSRKTQLFSALRGPCWGAAVFLSCVRYRAAGWQTMPSAAAAMLRRIFSSITPGGFFTATAPCAGRWGVSPAVNAPSGVSVAYTDSIPLLAVLCRRWPHSAAVPFSISAGSHFSAFLLQGGFGALLLRSVCRDGSAAGRCPAVRGKPILIERAFRHAPRGAQWLVLAALYCYFAAAAGAVRCTGGCFSLM